MPRNPFAKRSALSITLGCLILAALLTVTVATTASAAPAGTLTVTTIADAGPGSLRQAIADAAPGDTIDFSLMTPATITLTSGQLSIAKPLTITGPGPDLLAVSGNGASRVLQVDAPGGSDQISVTISGLTIRSGQDVDGGGLWSDGSLTLTHVIFWDNRATREGGGLYSNWASLNLINVAFTGNVAHNLGGGMCNLGGDATLTNLTFTANRAHRGGGLYNTGSLTIENSIVWNNRANERGDQIDNGSEGSVGSTTIARSDVEGSGGSGPGWDPGLGTDGGGNLDADPQFLAAPSPEDAPMGTHDLRLWFGSPAIDAGDNSYLSPGLGTDLGGRPRIVNGTVDMGAYEAQPGLYLRKTASDDWSPPGRPITYTLQVANAYTDTVMTGAVLSDRLPPGLAFAGPITLDPPGAGLVGAAPPVLVTDLIIQSEQVVTVTVPVTVQAGTPLGVLVNAAHMTSTQVLTPAVAGHDLLVCGPHLTVTSDADHGAGSLRQAIDLACPRGTIDFALNLPATITLLGDELRVMRPLTITGPGSELLAVSGNQAGRVLLAKNGGGEAQTAVNISGLTIRDGYHSYYKTGTGSGVWNSAALTLTGVTFRHNGSLWSAAGLYNASDGRVVLNDVAFRDNYGFWWGGAMANYGTALLENVSFVGNESRYGHGGGIYNSYSTLTLTHVLFDGNSADDYGGGLYNMGSTPLLTDVTFRRNSAAYGGGIAYPRSNVMTDMVFEGNSASRNGGGIYGGGNLSNAVFRDNMAGERGGGLHGGGTLMDVTFEGNSAGMGGGGMDGTGTLTHVTFLNNTAPLGGGMATSGATLDQVIFEGNRAESRGGGMDSIGTSTLRDVTFRGNVGGDGGGMFSAGWSALTNVVFEHNQAHSPSSLPSFGGGMNIMFGSPSLVNVLFYNNLADYGGGMANQADYGSGTPPSENISPTLTNVTLAGNVARIAGGGIYNLDSDPALQNSILWANQAVSGTQIYNGETSIPTIAYSDIQGSGGSGVGWDDSLGADLDNNLDADPWFRHPVDPGTVPTSTGDLRLRWGSPAIDAGHNDLLPPGVTTDLDGRPRIVNDIVDMGAYENQSRFVMVLPVVFKNSQP